MISGKKFGTFGGVFTPSVLTILGVIMYLRLGWVVGQAGLYYAVGIILIAHIISITTGLSLSSIATDKKIKSGGIYYMLSRSLGLPMGGAIGATIFLATALSISLYIVGFAESFLAVDAVSGFLNLKQDINSYRILGTATLLMITIVAFISTSLAIRIQYFVLAAIFLSLVSIVSGLFTSAGNEISVSLTPAENAPSLDVIFAVFFPAVTGFTVGVAMSGDLKNPKVSIPNGTLLSILAGLIVYVGLTIGFALLVDRSVLLADSGFLLQVAYYAPLVLAGIWGATLSSALGGILGGPRIIQALAKDKLAPSVLKRGYGVNNEPRVGLILTFLIAQAGILLGDLNTIASVVSMFFIAAYGFINLAFALESWASSDFRPSFKVPAWVGWVGFIASLIVMMQIDFLAMIIAFILIWITYFLMKKTEQKLDLGDVWQSVWSSVVRHSLHNMNIKGIEERNWRPNIILFTGNPKTRPHLFNLGMDMIGKHGFLTSVNIKLIGEDQKIPPRHEQVVKTNESIIHKGVFSREYYATNFYDGIKNIAETYGFAGVEPNTVLLGWSRENSDPVKYVQLINHIANLDLNLLLLDYDDKKGFGKRKTIDIWWRGAGNNGNLAINLVRFLWLTENWRESKTRLLIENPVNEEKDNIHRFASEVLTNLRINAEIIIINNEYEQKPFFETVRVESMHSDIIFIGIPEIEKGKEKEFIEQTNRLCDDLGTLILVKASTQFKKLNIGLKSTLIKPSITTGVSKGSAAKDFELPYLSYAFHPSFDNISRKLWNDNNLFNTNWYEKGFGRVFKQYQSIVQSAFSRIESSYSAIRKNIANIEKQESKDIDRVFFKLTNNSFVRFEQILRHFQTEVISEQQKYLELSAEKLKTGFEDFVENLPVKVGYTVNRDQLKKQPTDRLGTKVIKWYYRTFTSGEVVLSLKYKKVVSRVLAKMYADLIDSIWEQFGLLTFTYIQGQQKAFNGYLEDVYKLEMKWRRGEIQTTDVDKLEQHSLKVFNEFLDSIKRADTNLFSMVEKSEKKTWLLLRDAFDHALPASKIKAKGSLGRFRNTDQSVYIEKWQDNQQMLINRNKLDIALSSAVYRISHIIHESVSNIDENLNSEHNFALNRLPAKMMNFCRLYPGMAEKQSKIPDPGFKGGNTQILLGKIKDVERSIHDKLNGIVTKAPRGIKLFREEVMKEFYSVQFQHNEPQKVEVGQLLHYIINNDLLISIHSVFEKFSEELNRLNRESHEIAGLLKITLMGEGEEDQVELPEEFLKNQSDRAHHISEEYKLHTRSFYDELENALSNSSRQLNLSTFLQTAENLRLYVRNKEQQKGKSFLLLQWWSDTKNFFNQNLVKIWYDRSRRVVYAIENQNDNEIETDLPNSQLHTLSENLSVKKEVSEKIPSYYQHLFLRKNNYFMDFWNGRDNEINQALKIAERHERGFEGALMVTGEQNSGKTFFVNYLCNRYFTQRDIYVIQPPVQGSVSEAELLRAIQRGTEKYISADKIFKNLPDHTIVVFEDLELWWEKTREGLKIIEIISGYVKKYGKRIFFVMNMNLHAFKAVNTFYSMNDILLGQINCGPFSAEELKDIVMQRHRAGNIRFNWRGQKEEEMRSWDFARMFNSWFTFSRGNVGLCLQSWMASIEKVDEDKRIVLKFPGKMEFNALDNVDAKYLLVLVQFILHKRITAEKLSRIMQWHKDDADKILSRMKMSNLISDFQNGVYILNPVLHPFISNKLLSLELL